MTNPKYLNNLQMSYIRKGYFHRNKQFPSADKLAALSEDEQRIYSAMGREIIKKEKIHSFIWSLLVCIGAVALLYWGMTASSTTTNCTNGTYVNSAGSTVCSPETSSTVPSGATARCSDGTYSFSQSRRGTCSHHGGVSAW